MARYTSQELAGGTPLLIIRMLDNPVALLLARICVALPFLVAGTTKLLSWQQGVAEMAHVGLHPAWIFNLASLVTELAGAAAIIVNRAVWLGAGALGVFTLIATVLAHDFWNFAGAERIQQMNSFCEHATICAAFILLTVVSLRRPAA